MLFLLLYVHLTRANTNLPVELISQDALHDGFCHTSQMKLEFCFNCAVQSVEISIIAYTSQPNDNYLLQCWGSNDALQCTSGEWNAVNKTLLFTSTFNHTTHAGHRLRVNVMCNDNSTSSQHYLLKPCLSGFTGNATTNGTTVAVDCQHRFLNFSTSEMSIDFTGENNGTCSLSNCTDVKRLPNGIRYVGEYKQGMAFFCLLDGASLEITNITSVSGQVPTSDSCQTRILFEMISLSVFILLLNI